MNRKRRTRILIDFGKEESLKLAEIIENSYPIEMISEPSEALTMIKVRVSAKNSLFYLGEVLITETKVRIEGKVGTRFNVIAENAHIEGTVRTFDPATRDTVEKCLKHYAEEIARMYGGEAKVDYQRMTEPVNNEVQTANLVQQVAAASFGEGSVDNCPPTMGGEDFGHYMTKIPGAFATVGSGNLEKDTCWPHHSGRFNVDEETLKVGAELYAQYALAYLEQEKF